MNPECTQCGKRHWWGATRGSRLAEVRSPCCGAPMRLTRTDFVCFTCGKVMHGSPDYDRTECRACWQWRLEEGMDPPILGFTVEIHTGG